MVRGHGGEGLRRNFADEPDLTPPFAEYISGVVLPEVGGWSLGGVTVAKDPAAKAFVAAGG